MKKFALLAPAFVLVLAGCAHDQTVAAKIGGKGIPTSDVAVMASFLCASAKTQAGAQPVPLTQANTIATTYLVGSAVLRDIAARNGVKIADASADAVAPVIASLPADQQARSTTLLSQIDGTLAFVSQRMGATDGQQVLSALASMIASETKAGRLLSNPAYPTLAATASSSLSAAVSSQAKTADSVTQAQPPASYIAGLPLGQKCS